MVVHPFHVTFNDRASAARGFESKLQGIAQRTDTALEVTVDHSLFWGKASFSGSFSGTEPAVEQAKDGLQALLARTQDSFDGAGVLA